ncbi:Bacillosamine/Legionaminic acid biosynthesis aminotransferase PglE [Enhygromyxa salina]|uniref:Bacillosamine/Legionaminic acid biosynthesis aminotransferase PglE n=1 Tax=Enhygromyxa salina TaxID=215803 RepID=A0A0C2CS09_9BACT|nr:UDP-4-amino-4,6-dideoxy-N-acetyl-beta-L-altrosamine transaminase [Enhygromyxa salina]KIG13971.1 Bacillosamine/Legionaminic acid biosynthesis aminotransferase PglE [Enhygromyxa salina]
MADDILPYGRQWIDEDDIAAVVEALRGAYLTTGPTVARFEAALAEALGAAHVVAVCNGTAALHAACAVAGLGPGDEVLVPALTFLATANCARYVGAEPVFVDVDPRSGLIDVEHAASLVGPKTRAIIPVHLNGRPVDLPAIRALADRHDLVVIEDAAHALGAQTADSTIGDCRYSDMAIFSFHPVKHVTTGEGGAITTAKPKLAAALEVFRSHGMVRDPALLRHASPGPWYYEQHTLGYNYRITDLQCALGLSQLTKLDRFVARRRELAARYDQLLTTVSGVEPVAVGTAGTRSAYHLYAVHVDFAAIGQPRAQVVAALRELGILTQVHYIPVPTQPYYTDRGADPLGYPGATAYYEGILSLPLFPAMRDEDVDRVVAALTQVLG